jgi:hypothetical protein
VEWADLQPVFEAPHEVAAVSVQAVLQDEGIPAVIRSAHVPAYGGVSMSLSGAWGWVLVPRSFMPQARAIVQAYLRCLQSDPDEDPRRRR